MNVTEEVNEMLILAYELARNKRSEYVTPEHLLYAILSSDSEIIKIVEELDGELEVIKKALLDYIDNYLEKVESGEPQESIGIRQVFMMAMQMVFNSSKDIIGMKHIMAAIYELDESYAAYYLIKQGIEKRNMLYSLCHREDFSSDYDDFDFDDDIDDDEDDEDDYDDDFFGRPRIKSYLAKYAINLNETVNNEKYDPLIGREDIIERTIQVLCRRVKNNPIHIGESGVGKTAITLGLAKLINEGRVPEKLKNSVIYMIDMGSLLAGTKFRGDFEERVKNVLDEAKDLENPIIYIDEIHNIVGAGALSGGSMDASNLLKPYLNEGIIRFIGATTYDEFKKHFEKDKALVRRFQKIEIKETTTEETIQILERLKSNFEGFHGVTYTKEAIISAVLLSSKYINDRFLPDKAIDVIDEAGAYVSIKSEIFPNMIIDENIIEEIISKTCNIPKQTVLQNEAVSLKNLENNLKEKIFGQNSAVEEVVRCIKLSRAGLNDDNKPIASMLFVGPTGVGKTEIAKCISKCLSIELIRFDMSEYMEKHAASKLIGAPPGYVGYEEGGMLTDIIRKKPHCVLLLDEVEKAHADIFNVLLQVMDYASLTDNQGRKADFRNVIIIMTSNAGARNIGKTLIGFNDREIKGEVVLEEVKKIFSPEFRNRLDKVIAFNHIDEDMAINIVKKEIGIFKDKLEKKQVNLEFTNEFVKHIVKSGISKEFGAREIKRVINQEVKPLLVEELLFGKLINGGKCILDIKDEKVSAIIDL